MNPLIGGIHLKIKRVLNNNAVVIEQDASEQILLGSGIGFKKNKDDSVDENKVDKIYVLKEDIQKIQSIITKIPEDYFTMAEKITAHVSERLNTSLHPLLVVTLADHIYFSHQRLLNGIYVPNKLLSEIKALYQNEYELSVWAVNFISEYLKTSFPEDEIGFIALHLHGAKQRQSDNLSSTKKMNIIHDAVKFITSQLPNGKLDEIMYLRLITHLRYTVDRAKEKDDRYLMDPEIMEMIIEKCPDGYQISVKLSDYLKKEYALELNKSEIGYISLHIQRLLLG